MYNKSVRVTSFVPRWVLGLLVAAHPDSSYPAATLATGCGAPVGGGSRIRPLFLEVASHAVRVTHYKFNTLA